MPNRPSDDIAPTEQSPRPRNSGPVHFQPRRLRDIEREAVERTLALTGNNQSAAARILGISRPTLARKLLSYRIADNAAGQRFGDR